MGVAHALNKDGKIAHTQPECFGPWFPVALSARKVLQMCWRQSPLEPRADISVGHRTLEQANNRHELLAL